MQDPLHLLQQIHRVEAPSDLWGHITRRIHPPAKWRVSTSTVRWAAAAFLVLVCLNMAVLRVQPRANRQPSDMAVMMNLTTHNDFYHE